MRTDLMPRFWLMLALYVGVVLGVAVPAHAADTNWSINAQQQIGNWQNQLTLWQRQPPAVELLDQRLGALLDLRQRADDCVRNGAGPLAALQAELDALGKPNPDESAEVKRLRRDTQLEKDARESQLALCRVVGVAAGNLLAEFKALRARTLTSALGRRGADLLDVARQFLQQPQFLRSAASGRFDWWPSLMVGLGAFLVLFPLSRYIAGLLRRVYPEPAPPAAWKIQVLFAHMLARRLPWIAGLIGLATVAYLGNAPLIGAALVALLVSLTLAPMIEMLLCQSVYRCVGGMPMRILLDLSLIGLALHWGGLGRVLTGQADFLLYAAYLLLVMGASLWLLFALASRDDMRVLRNLRLPVVVMLVAGPLALGLGYRSLAGFLVPGVYGSLAGLLVAWMLYHPFAYLLNLLDTDRTHNSERLRGFLGYKDDEQVPGLWLGHLMLMLLLLVVLATWLLFVWQVPDAEIQNIGAHLLKGVSIGGLTLVPGKLVMAVVVFLLVMALVRWLRSQLSQRWLTRTRLDAGARQSVESLTTYAIIGLALISSLSLAGVSLQNLAIVAGALSVGIGFGLQNIVNNFVSGLILLFERPVRPGDWVVVGGTEGYVKRVSIRSTQIQTFDRADVLVPNSELISSQVTNWMLRDRMGRVVAAVGVAYGSDTELVSSLLIEVAKKHPMVIVRHSEVPPPQVLFMAFGDSSLNFELRCFIHEIDQRLRVRSELLFAIDKAFRQAGIEIPFPQRVVHMPDSGAPNPPPPAGTPPAQ